MASKAVRMVLGLLVAGAAITVSAPLAGAATINVTTTDDSYDAMGSGCSLREAITAAQTNSPFSGCPAGSGADTVLLGDGTYRITRPGAGEDGNATGDFDVVGTDPLTIEPAGSSARVVIDGNELDRVFHQGGAAALALNRVTVTGGRLVAVEDGGGILNGGSGGLSLDGVTVTGNRSRISGGGIAAYNSVSLINSTVSGNSSEGSGGGIYLPGGSSATVRSSTIADNTADADADGNGDGGGFAEAGSAGIAFFNVINADNHDLSPNPADRAPDCSSGMAFSPRFTLSTQEMGTGGCLTGADPGSNLVVADAGMLPLAMNGGQTFTHALEGASPAVDAGGSVPPDTCPPTDQRGVARPAGRCDIGSYELKEIFEPPILAPPAMFDGKRLLVRLKCPARFRPFCRSKAVPVTRKKGKAMARPKRLKINRGRWRYVSFQIKPAYRDYVMSMTTKNKKLLVTRQVIRSKKLGTKRNRKARTVFHRYKVTATG